MTILVFEDRAAYMLFYKFDSGKYRTKFEEYFKKEIYGQGGANTFQEIFGDPKALLDEVMQYVKDLK